VEAVRRLQPDILIHLGDFYRDAQVLRESFPSLPLCAVRGNCDLGWCDAPDTDTVSLGPVKAFVTHGHLYNVRYSRDSLVYAAMEAGASLALYGHTHIADHAQYGGITVLNPGTAGKGRDLSYAVIQVYPGGGVACKIEAL